MCFFTKVLIFDHVSAVDSTEPLPLMEGEGRSFRVLGFNQNQRAAFVQILMRFTSVFAKFNHPYVGFRLNTARSVQ